MVLVPLTETGHEFYVTTMTKFLSNTYETLGETLKHLKSKTHELSGGQCYILLCRNIGWFWALLEWQILWDWSHILHHLYLWRYLWLHIKYLVNSEVKEVYGVYQEALCVWYGFHTTRGSHRIWFPLARGNPWIPRPCWIKAVGTYCRKIKTPKSNFASKRTHCGTLEVSQ